jgi:hypothetical protein
MAKIGSALDSAVGHYNSSVGSYESRVLVSARRLANLSAVEAAEGNDAGAAAAVTPKATEQVGSDNEAADATVPKAKKRPRDKQAASSDKGAAAVEESSSGNVESSASAGVG